MIDPDSRLSRELKAAEDFFALARTATSPFMRGYCQRVGERYLSSKGELKSLVKQNDKPYPATGRTGQPGNAGGARDVLLALER